MQLWYILRAHLQFGPNYRCRCRVSIWNSIGLPVKMVNRFEIDLIMLLDLRLEDSVIS